jgi:hypothetical protein
MIVSRPHITAQLERPACLLLAAVFILLGAADLTGRPGTNLVTNYNSATNQVLMDVTSGAGMPWRVDVLRIDSNWHASLTLSIRRTGTGSGTGTVTGGGSFLAITTASQTFVTGSGSRAGVQLQERIAGVSVSIGAGTFTTTIQYTVVDI